MAPLLDLQRIDKAFDAQPVLRDVSLSLPAGEIVALLGPSGSGKTTLLRIIAGLETADGGTLRLEGEDLTQIPVHRRGFGMVFQEYALFPHKDVGENVAFGLRMLGWDRARSDERVAQVLDLVGLAGFGPRPVHELSGGEQQRVALARALAPAPRLLLLDEPLGALDRALRERLMLELRDILKRAGQVGGAEEQGDNALTAIYVTHDQAEAFAIADRVVVMNEGRIEQVDAPVELYRHPRTPFVARFIGMENLFEGEVVGRDPLRVQTPVGELSVAGNQLSVISDQLSVDGEQSPVSNRQSPVVLIRPDAARVLAEDEEAVNPLPGRVQEISFRGRYQIVTVAVAEDVVLKLEFEADVELPPAGERVRLGLDPAGIALLKGQD